MVVHACNPSAQEAGQENYHEFKARLGCTVKSCLKVIKNKGWECNTVGRMLAYQAQGSVLCTEYHKPVWWFTPEIQHGGTHL